MFGVFGLVADVGADRVYGVAALAAALLMLGRIAVVRRSPCADHRSEPACPSTIGPARSW